MAPVVMEETSMEDAVYTNITRDESTGYEIATSEFLPPLNVSTEFDTYANHSPQYITHLPSGETDEQQSSTRRGQGRQLEQNIADNVAGTGYSSCKVVPPTREPINSVEAAPQNPCRYGEDEKEGYVRPVEVFNPMSTGETSSINSNDTPTGAHTGARKKKQIRRLQEQRQAENPDTQLEENGYLSPTDDLDKEIKMTGNSNENPYTGTPKATRREFQRFDSGVDDCDHGKDTVSPTLLEPTPFRDRLSTSIEEHYEDIDVYRNESKPTSSTRKKESGKTTRMEKEDSMKIRILSRSTAQNSKRPSVEKERTHPASQSNKDTSRATHRRPPSSAPDHYTDIEMNTPLVKPEKKKEIGGRQRCILATILLVLFLLVTLSLSISISMLIMQVYSKDNKNNSNNAVVEGLARDQLESKANATRQMHVNVTKILEDEKLLSELQSQLLSLKAENLALKETIGKQKNETMAKLDEFTARHLNISTQIGSMASQFGTKIDNITDYLQTKGLDSLSSCSLKSTTSTKLTFNGIHLETTFQPSKLEVQDNFVLFAFCTFMGMEDVSLDVQKEGSRSQYRCRCKAVKKGLTYKSCTLYYWLCPQR